MTLTVQIGRGHPTARFHSATNDSFDIDLLADGLTASRSVYIDGYELNALAAFFEDLADSWSPAQHETAVVHGFGPDPLNRHRAPCLRRAWL
ncbi:MAG: hypothetical protein AAGD35_11290 [Actinomycetota bacterium]